MTSLLITDPRVIGTEQLRDLLGMPPLYSDVVDAPLAEDVDEEEEDGDLYYTNSKRPASIASASPPAYEATPTFPQGANRLAPYAPHVLAPSTVLPPVKVRYHNRDDVLANTSAKTQAWRTQRKEKGAAKKAAKGKGEKLAKLHREALWVSEVLSSEADGSLLWREEGTAGLMMC